MKILVIHGSMRKGNTYALTKEIVDRLAKKGDVEITEISVADLDLPFCRSCHICFSQGEEFCPHYERLTSVRDALDNCDGLVISGTTYLLALNAAMKNLLDHFAYIFHRPTLFGKQGMVIATSAGNGERGVAAYLKEIIGQWGINEAQIVTLNTKDKMMQTGSDEFSPEYLQKLDATAQEFYQRIKRKRPTSPSLKAIAIHNAFRAMSLSEFSDSERDTHFWSQSGYRDQSYPVRIGFMKTLVGNLVFFAANKATIALGRSYKNKRTK